MILKMNSFKPEDRLTAIEIYEHLISANEFNIKNIESINL